MMNCENCRIGLYTFVGGIYRCDRCGHERPQSGTWEYEQYQKERGDE